MRKWDVLVIVLLITSLGFNIFIWQEVKDIRENQVGIARRDQLERISSCMSEAVQALEGLAKEQKWVQESSFELNKEKSHAEEMVVQGTFTFNRLEQNQVPYVLYRKKGTKNWEETKLQNIKALTYTAEIVLSPFEEYEYQLVAKGEKEKASEIALIPYNLYGLPRWKTEIKPIISSNSTSIDFYIYVYTANNYPLPEMEPQKVSFKLISGGEVIQTVPLVRDKNSPADNTWSLKWSLSDAAVIDEVEAFIEMEYKNGLQKTEKIELFKERVRYEIKKRIQKIPVKQ